MSSPPFIYVEGTATILRHYPPGHQWDGTSRPLVTISALKPEEVKLEEAPSTTSMLEDAEVRLREKLMMGLELTEKDEQNVAEMAEAAGWGRDDLIEDLAAPQSYGHYLKLSEKYFNEAKRVKEEDSGQAAEKMWGAITAFIKAYASSKGVIISHWSRRKLERFVENNVEPKWKPAFYELLEKGTVLHEHFYEKYLSQEHFNELFDSCESLLKELKSKLRL